MNPPDPTPRCRSCKAPVQWALNKKTGSRMPLDVEEHPRGNIALLEDPTGIRQPTCRYLKEGELPSDGESRRVSHFATCPDAKKWRR